MGETDDSSRHLRLLPSQVSRISSQLLRLLYAPRSEDGRLARTYHRVAVCFGDSCAKADAMHQGVDCPFDLLPWRSTKYAVRAFVHFSVILSYNRRRSCNRFLRTPPTVICCPIALRWRGDLGDSSVNQGRWEMRFVRTIITASPRTNSMSILRFTVWRDSGI